MDLARELGMTVKQLDENLDEGEFQHWLAYFHKRDFSWSERWVQHATMMRLGMSIFSTSKQNIPSVRDLMPDLSFGGV